MTTLGHVLLVAGDTAEAQRLAVVLRGGGFAVEPTDVARAAAADGAGVELVLIDARAAGGKAADVVRSLRTHPHPVALIADTGDADIRRASADLGVDELFEAPCPDDVLLARLRPLCRLATQSAELDRRAASVRALGHRLDSAVAAIDARLPSRLLVVADPGGATGRAVHATFDREFQVSYEPDPYVAADILAAQRFDAAIVAVDDAVAGEPSIYLTRHLRNNPQLFNLPVVLVHAPGVFDRPLGPYAAGASVALRAPPDAELLRATVAILVRRQRLRRALHAALRATAVEALLDPTTGVFARAFLEHHLATLIGHARQRDRDLTVARFQVTNLEALSRRHGADAGGLLLRQVADWIRDLVRMEDVVARADDQGFAVLLPDTAPDEAQVVAQRIAGILRHSEFALGEAVTEPVRAWLEAGTAALEAGDTADSLLTRARANVI